MIDPKTKAIQHIDKYNDVFYRLDKVGKDEIVKALDIALEEQAKQIFKEIEEYSICNCGNVHCDDSLNEIKKVKKKWVL